MIEKILNFFGIQKMSIKQIKIDAVEEFLLDAYTHHEITNGDYEHLVKKLHSPRPEGAIVPRPGRTLEDEYRELSDQFIAVEEDRDRLRLALDMAADDSERFTTAQYIDMAAKKQTVGSQ